MSYYRNIDDYKPLLKKLLEKVGESTGDKSHPFICPFCKSGSGNNRKFSSAFSIHHADNTYKCFSCGAHGNIFNLISFLYEIPAGDLPAQMEKIDEVLGLKGRGSSTKTNQKTASSYKGYIMACNALATEPTEEYAKMHTAQEYEAEINRRQPGISYLKGRGLKEDIIKRFNIGYDDYNSNYKDIQRPANLTIKQPCIIIPHNRDFSYFVARAADANNKAFFYPAGSNGEKKTLYNPEALTESKICFICESQLDAVSVYQAQANAIKAGKVSEEIAGAVALGGMQDISCFERTVDLLADNIKADRFIISLDNEDRKETDDARKKLADYLDKKGFIYTFAEYNSTYKDWNEILVNESDRVFSIISDNVRAVRDAEPPTPPQCLNQILIKFDDIIANRRIISTGFDNLDSILATSAETQGRRGIETGITLLLGNSSIGKSTFLLNLAYNIASNPDSSDRVLYLSYEMRAPELLAKLISRNTFRPADKLQGIEAGAVLDIDTIKRFSEEQANRLKEAKRRLSGIDRLEIYDDAPDRDRIKSLLDKHRRLYKGEPAPLVFVDFLQAMPAIDIHKGPRENTDEYLKFFRNLSAEYDTPIVILTSVARAHYFKPITMECGKESGNLEYYADTVLGLQAAEVIEDDNPAYDQKQIEKTHSSAALKVHKSRNPRNVKIKVLKRRIGKVDQEAYFEYYCAYDYFERNGFNGVNADGKTELYTPEFINDIINGSPAASETADSKEKTEQKTKPEEHHQQQLGPLGY